MENNIKEMLKEINNELDNDLIEEIKNVYIDFRKNFRKEESIQLIKNIYKSLFNNEEETKIFNELLDKAIKESEKTK